MRDAVQKKAEREARWAAAACLEHFHIFLQQPLSVLVDGRPHRHHAQYWHSVQKKAEREARRAAAAEARPTGRSESSEEDQATYDLTANAAMYNEGLHQLDASSCNILKESSTFINEPAPPLTQEQPAFREQPAAQVRKAGNYCCRHADVATELFPLSQ